MKIQENQTAWKSVSARQLKSLALASHNDRLLQVADRYADCSADQIDEALNERQDMAYGLAGLATVGSGVAFGGAAIGRYALMSQSLACPVLAGIGGVFVALTVCALGKALGHEITRHDVEAGSKAVAQGLVKPGPTADTFVDGRFWDGGKFSQVQAVRQRDTGATLSRHVRLDTPSPVMFDEDCKSGQVTITTAQGKVQIPGKLSLPTAKERSFQVEKLDLPNGDRSVQTFAVNGTSSMFYLMDDDKTSASQEFGSISSDPKNTWDNGYKVRLGRDWNRAQLVNPMVHADEMGLASGNLKSGEVVKRTPWGLDVRPAVEKVFALEVPSLERGAMTTIPTKAVVGLSYEPSNKVRLRAQGEEVRVSPNHGESYSLQAQLSVREELTYQCDGHPVIQTFPGNGVRLTASFPEGTVKLVHNSQGEPQTELYWGELSQGPIPVAQHEGKYEVEIAGRNYSIQAAVGLDLL